MTPTYIGVKTCRVCSSAALCPVIDLGSQPPANSLRRHHRIHLPRIPLELIRCGTCAALQLSVSVDPTRLFRHYVWVTGTSTTARHYAESFCDEALHRLGYRPAMTVEIASNDGTFLTPFLRRGLRVLGIDPARNIALQASRAGVPTRTSFFGLREAHRLLRANGAADLVIARNVLPHVPDCHDVLAGIRTLLADNGIGVIEFHDARVVLQELHYDSIYHEHHLYLSLRTLAYLLQEQGLFAFDVMTSPISGGSLVVFFSHSRRRPTAALARELAKSRKSGVNTASRWRAFARKALVHRERLRNIVTTHAAKGTVVGYGASARSSTLLNFCGINSSHVRCIADQNPLKHQHYTPGTDIPIWPPERVFGLKPSAVLLLAWNFEREILGMIRDTFSFRGSVIVPLPGPSQVLELG